MELKEKIAEIIRKYTGLQYENKTIAAEIMEEIEKKMEELPRYCLSNLGGIQKNESGFYCAYR